MKKIDAVVADFCAAVIAEPMSYFSEGDLQGQLFARLLRAFPRFVPTGVQRGPESRSVFKTPLVHREYGAGSGRRIDLVMLGADDLASADRNLTHKGKYLTPAYGFELGTEKSNNADAHIKGDIRKLARCRTRGYLIHFFRDVTSAAHGSKLRARAEEKIERVFRSHAAAAEPEENVRALFFLVRLAWDKRNIRGRCRVLEPSKRQWVAVSDRKVRREVLRMLE